MKRIVKGFKDMDILSTPCNLNLLASQLKKNVDLTGSQSNLPFVSFFLFQPSSILQSNCLYEI